MSVGKSDRDSWEYYVEKCYDDVQRGVLDASFDRLVAPHLREDPARILDVGTGPGQYLAVLAGRFPDAALYGVDTNASYVRSAETELEQRGVGATLVRGDGERLPFPTSSVDLVVNQLTMPYSKNERLFLAESMRVVRPGGCLWLSTHGFGFFLARMETDGAYGVARWLGSIASGVLSMSVGWKPISDTPVTRRWLENELRRLGGQIAATEVSSHRRVPRVVHLAVLKRR